MIPSAKHGTLTIPAKPASADGSPTQEAASLEHPAQCSIPTAEPLSQEFAPNATEATMWIHKQRNVKLPILNAGHPTLAISTFVQAAMVAMCSSIANASLSAPSSVNILLFRESRSRIIRLFRFFRIIRLIRLVRQWVDHRLDSSLPPAHPPDSLIKRSQHQSFLQNIQKRSMHRMQSSILPWPQHQNLHASRPQLQHLQQPNRSLHRMLPRLQNKPQRRMLSKIDPSSSREQLRMSISFSSHQWKLCFCQRSLQILECLCFMLIMLPRLQIEPTNWIMFVKMIV